VEVETRLLEMEMYVQTVIKCSCTCMTTRVADAVHLAVSNVVHVWNRHLTTYCCWGWRYATAGKRM